MTSIEQHTFTPEQSTRLRAHVLEQMKSHTEACISLAKALFEIYYGTIAGSDRPLVVAWGFEDFEQFVEKELLMHGGTARSYVRVYDELCIRRHFDDGQLPCSIVALRELAKISHKVKDKTELDRWVKRAFTLTACELKDAVESELFGRKGKKRTIGFHMQWAAAGRCLKRIRDAREALGFSTNGEALERIITEWGAGRMTASERRRAG